MNVKHRRVVADAVENEGLDYAFVHYSDFPEVEDEKFHAIRESFLAARAALITYCELENV